MKKLGLKTTFKLLITPTIIIGSIFVLTTYGQDYPGIEGFIKPINAIIYTGDSDKNVFDNSVKAFCDIMSKDGKYYSTKGDLVYNANKSLFMYTLCKQFGLKNYDIREGFSEQSTRSYILIKQDRDGNNYNVLDNSLPDLYDNTESYIQTLFDTLMANYTSIYQANIYGYANTDKTKEELANAFSHKYFPLGNSQTDIEICGSNKQYSYDKTCKKLKEYLQGASNILNNSNNIMNQPLIYAIYQSYAKNNGCDAMDSNGIPNPNYNMVACGVYGDLNNYINLIYNELFFYVTFSEYYKFALSIQPNFKNSYNSNMADKVQNQMDRIDTINANIQHSQQAISTTIRFVKQLQMTFPIHIGLLMYSEDIDSFAGQFNKILTPIYTLYDLFRNVQIKN